MSLNIETLQAGSGMASCLQQKDVFLLEDLKVTKQLSNNWEYNRVVWYQFVL